MSSVAGYSGTPLAQKLGLKDGQRVLFISLPPELKDLRKSRNFIEIAEASVKRPTRVRRSWLTCPHAPSAWARSRTSART